MNRCSATLSSVLLLVLGIVIMSGEDAHAYLDPGSGSYFFQLAIAGIIGATFSIKLWWGKIVEVLFHNNWHMKEK